MRNPVFGALIAGALLLTTASVAGANICLSIDEPQDTLSPQDRVASLLLLARQFELAGEEVVSEGCTASYTLSHVKLGNVIIVTLSGPAGQREGKALGLDDLPSLYSQMVRSITTGRPMEGFNVVDRTNVTTAQAASPRVSADSFGYARLGYSGTFAGSAQGAPAMGFGYRAELDSFALDISFLNYQIRSSTTAFAAGGGYYGSGGGFSGSFLKLEALYFLKPEANASPYFGGGLSWGGVSRSSGTATSQTSLRGSGLQGELTVGYELPRASTLRVFVQADVVLPFYQATSETVTFRPAPPYTSRAVGDRRYVPSLVMSIGVGWQRHRR